MKKGFSLLELIFAIVVIGVIASFAVPKFLDTKDSAVVSTLKRDIATTISAIQSYQLSSNNDITSIDQAITLNKENWTVNGLKITDKVNSCLEIEIKTDDNGEKTLELTVNKESKSSVCKKLIKEGIEDQKYQLM